MDASFLQRFDRFRQDEVGSGFRREAADGVVRAVALHGRESAILYSRHPDRAELEKSIEREIRYFESLGHDFEWKLYEHDEPADLAAILLEHNFQAGDREALMALDLQETPAQLLQPPGDSVRRITDPADIGAYLSVPERIWGKDQSERGREYVKLLADHPDSIGLYVASVDDRPVSSARISFHGDHPFAGLWGGGTLAEYRGQGFYQALLRARIQAAIERGVRYVTVDALPTSQPILERRGFKVVSYTRPFLWQCRTGATR